MFSESAAWYDALYSSKDTARKPKESPASSGHGGRGLYLARVDPD